MVSLQGAGYLKRRKRSCWADERETGQGTSEWTSEEVGEEVMWVRKAKAPRQEHTQHVPARAMSPLWLKLGEKWQRAARSGFKETLKPRQIRPCQPL